MLNIQVTAPLAAVELLPSGMRRLSVIDTQTKASVEIFFSEPGARKIAQEFLDPQETDQEEASA